MPSRPPSRSGATDPNADLAEVVARVGASKTSFYSAMRLLPEDRRNAMFAIYAFCREVDDIADEPGTQEAKQQGLDLWRCEIEAIYAGRPPSLPLARALVGPIHQFGLLKQDFIAVIDGMQMDAERDIKAPSLEELDLYCARVASAVGRLSVRIFGDWRPRADEVADHLGRALQLTNILRDLDEDASRGRLYLPREILLRHGIDSFEPRMVLNHPAIGRVCTDIAAEARRRYDLAHAAMRDCKRRAMRPAAIMSGIYAKLLDRLVARGWTPPRRPVRVPTPVKIWIALKHGFL